MTSTTPTTPTAYGMPKPSTSIHDYLYDSDYDSHCDFDSEDEHPCNDMYDWNAYMTHPIGYPRLSQHIAMLPQTGIYRRFDALNARHLLYLQSELCILEKKLHGLEEKDNKAKEGARNKYALRYEKMLEEPLDIPRPQLELIREMHGKLDEYNKALIQVSTLQTLHYPSPRDLKTHQNFLWGEEMGYGTMCGEDSTTWGHLFTPDFHPPDLVTMKPSKPQDTFSWTLGTKGICWLLPFRFGSLWKQGMVPTAAIDSLTSWITTIFAAALPIAAIFVLLSLQDMQQKLRAVVGFIVASSLCMRIFTLASRPEIFIVTALIAALQVFVIGTISVGKDV